ncbi:Nonribosomal peptide synthase NPS2, partial [Frankliniella fusca]
PTGDGKADAQPDKEIFMYDASSDEVSRLTGELSTSFVEVAESNALSQDLESVDAEGDVVEQDTASSDRQEVRVAPPEGFLQRRSDDSDTDDMEGAASDPVGALLRASAASIGNQDVPQVAISSGYARTSLS